MHDWIRPLTVTTLPAIAALALSVSPQSPLNIYPIFFVLLVFVPYIIAACCFHSFALRRGTTDYAAYLVAGLFAGIAAVAVIAVSSLFLTDTSPLQAKNIFMFICPTALIYGAGLASFFWAWVVSTAFWPRLVSLLGLCLLLAPYRMFVMGFGAD